jgi:hypothetical protein
VRPRARLALARAARRAAPGEALTRCELRLHSQNGEDGVLAAIRRRIGPGSRRFVEFGIGEGAEGNCVALAEVLGWSGVFLEADPDLAAGLEQRYAARPAVRTACERITAGTVEAIFERHGVPEHFEILSLDIDGNDFWVWQALERFRPRVVVIEYNSHLPLDRRLVMPRADGYEWDATDYHGASLGAMRALGREKGYELVHTDSTGVNAFFVERDATDGLPAGDRVPLHPANLGGQGVRLDPDPQRRPWLDLDRGELVVLER